MPGARTRIAIAKPDIVAHFDQDIQRVFSHADIRKVLTENRRYWRLATGETTASFIKWLVRNTKMTGHRFALPYRPEIRYTWGEVPFFQLVNSLKPQSYFTHFTAFDFHGLTNQVPKTVYLNHEQGSSGTSTGGLTQEGITRAFSNPQRQSNNRCEYDGRTICVVNGRATGRLGVIRMDDVDTTDLERTLIDATVRPAYCGGVAEVLAAYESARDRLSVNRLSAYLKKLAYVYPYHQAVGFYLERAGYAEAQLDLVRRMPRRFDFYLANAMKQTDYDANWRLFFPKGF